jgi:flagellar P-ring protein FlgI
MACGLTLWRLVGPLLAALAALTLLAAEQNARAQTQIRIKDLVEVEGVRSNELVGYGLVVGLDGSGDRTRNAPYTEAALKNMLERLGLTVEGEAVRPQNVAAVVVTARLGPFARRGSKIDVTVAAIGDAKSLLGGVLVMTPLAAADGNIYAVAQGPVIAGGFSAEGMAESVTQGVPTVAVVPGGGRVEREIAFAFGSLSEVRLALSDPDFTTAMRIETAVNEALGPGTATMTDPGTVQLIVPQSYLGRPAHLLAAVEAITVMPARRARVVIDQRSGTIVLGSDVRISPVAVAQGNLTIRVREEPLVSQPSPLARRGETVVVPRTGVETEETNARLGTVRGGASLGDLVAGLNALGVDPRGLIDILAAIKTAGALHADLIVQ